MYPSPVTDAAYLQQRLVVGYHACDRDVLQSVLLEGGSLSSSKNTYDWLGEGIYFWEHGLERAFDFGREQQARGRINTPAVLGAYIHLGRCFDLTDTSATKHLNRFHELLSTTFAEQGIALPENRAASADDHDLLLRNLDCAVMNFAMSELDEGAEGTVAFQTIRGVFVEGPPVYKGARIHTKTHIQIAVRDPSCILGFFVPNS